jgi:hypothetical protein
VADTLGKGREEKERRKMKRRVGRLRGLKGGGDASVPWGCPFRESSRQIIKSRYVDSEM